MHELILEEPFFNLPEIGLEDKIDGFFLDTERYEEEMAQRNGGLYLKSIPRGSISGEDIARYEKLVPYHMEMHSPDLLKDVVGLAKKHPKPFAKVVKNVKELERDILMTYQIGYAHYVIAKHYGFEYGRKFPNGCCGPAGRGCMVTLWTHGFLNAAYALYGRDIFKFNHGYVVLPFVMEEPEFKGVMIMDPTSDQLSKVNGKIRRNLVAIKQGLDWSYKMRFLWFPGPEMFPYMALHLGVLTKEKAIEIDGNITTEESLYFQGGKQFLKEAYSNPTELQVPLNRTAN